MLCIERQRKTLLGAEPDDMQQGKRKDMRGLRSLYLKASQDKDLRAFLPSLLLLNPFYFPSNFIDFGSNAGLIK